MKKVTKLKAFMLSLTMTALLLPMTSFAQQTSDDFFRVDDAFNGNRAVAIALTGNLANDDFGAPLGSGLLILTAAGAGYAISRRKRSFRKGSALVLAALMLLGMTACKKKIAEPITPATGNQVAITLNVGGGAKAEVDPPHVNFVENDKILVAHDGKYVGTLTYTEYETGKFHFQGNIDATVATPRQKLYFYFLGNKQNDASLEAGTTTSCTVNISDQTNYPTLPVISFSASDEDYEGAGTYNAKLHNKCSLIKFKVTTPSTAPICITGMNNQVTVKFNDRTSNDGFSYGMADANGVIKMKGVASSGAATWAIVLQQDELPAGAEGTAYTTDFSYVGARAAVPAITMDQYLNEDRPMTVSTHVWNGNLAALGGSEPEGFATARDGMTIYNELTAKVKISIASGATVTLSGATINGTNDISYSWAGLTCLGDATIILKDGSANNVKGFHEDYPGIHVPAENTLTIKGETLGTGSLNASSYPVASGSGAGIGGGENLACGNIEIQGGVITATGSTGAAGIGSGNYGCGTITISGGTITATGGASGAGIGSGFGGGCGNITISGGIVTSTGGDFSAGIGGGKTGSCGNITIESTVTNVTAVRGTAGSYSIGRGDNGTCGTVTIGGVETGPISTSPYTYPAPYNANTNPLTFEAKADGFTVTLTSTLDPLPSLEYSIDGGAWTTYTCNAATPSVNTGHTIAFRGDNLAFFNVVGMSAQQSNFSCTADCYLYGNIMSLLSASGYATATSVGETALLGLFMNNTKIYSHDTKQLVLPATTLAPNCYGSLFNGCTALTRAPELPATTLDIACYGRMFYGCTALTTAPVLRATTLVNGCYSEMFIGCTNLNSVTCLATNISAENCTNNWLDGVDDTGTFTKAASMTGWTTGVSGIPSSWTRVNAD